MKRALTIIAKILVGISAPLTFIGLCSATENSDYQLLWTLACGIALYLEAKAMEKLGMGDDNEV